MVVVCGIGRIWSEYREPFGDLEESISITIVAIVFAVRAIIQCGTAVVCLWKFHNAKGKVIYHRHLFSILPAFMDLSGLFVNGKGRIMLLSVRHHWLSAMRPPSGRGNFLHALVVVIIFILRPSSLRLLDIDQSRLDAAIGVVADADGHSSHRFGLS